MIIFKNPGRIDLRALTTFGLSSKEGQGKIGRFGTGLKYAVAVLLRSGANVSIWTDEAWHEIGVRTEEFREREMLQATLNGNDLPFTTDLGRDWEIWQAFRELYSNALDEDGQVTRSDIRPIPDIEETIIAVDLDAFEAIYFTMEEHFIGQDEAPVYESSDIQIFKGRSSFVFYKGIAVQKLKKPAAYRYNILGYVDLTEDRTAKYSWQVTNHIAEALLKCKNADITSSACDQRNPFEATIDFSDIDAKPSEEFLGASVNLNVNANPSAVAVVRAQLPEDTSRATILQKGTPGSEALRSALQTLRDIGADLSKARFVLAEGLQIYKDFDVRGDAVFLSETIFESEERMRIAAIEGYAAVAGNSWLVRQVIKLSQSEGAS